MRAILCSFSGGPDDMPRKQQADPIAVLRVLKRAGRFSAFEASDNMVIARTITNLFHKSLMGRGRMLEMDDSMGYPWTKVVLTPAAKQLLAELDASPSPIAPTPTKEIPVTDRELLEAAAKAAGIKIDRSPYNGGGHGNTGFDVLGNAVLDWHNGVKWNPLTDDGDALRLAVKLNIWPFMKTYPGFPTNIFVQRGDAYWDELAQEPIGEDPCAATRRAIVRAAASLAAREAP